MGVGDLWEVIGGGDKGGIVVRCDCDLDSEVYDNRLATGAKIKELGQRGQRLQYRLLTGSGPKEGWISLSLKGQPLVQKQHWDPVKRHTLSIDKLLLRHESEGTFDENYELEKDCFLGEGGFASVLVAHNRNTGQKRAIKQLPYKKNEELRKIDAECRILVRLAHPHIMKFHEFFREPQMIYLVTELCTGGTFKDFFRDSPWDMEDACILFQQVLSAIQHCHKMRVLHHDLKPENCLMLKSSGRPFAKVIDFGIATIMQVSNSPSPQRETSDEQKPELSEMIRSRRNSEVEEPDTVKKITGTAFWRAPEVLDPDNYSGPKADVYAIGLIMFLCLTGTHPLHHGTWIQPLGKTERMEMYDEMPMELLDKRDIPEEARELIYAVLEKDKQKRVNAKQALLCQWFEAEEFVKQYPPSPRMTKDCSFSGLSEIASPSSIHGGLSPRSSKSLSPRGLRSPRTSGEELREPWPPQNKVTSADASDAHPGKLDSEGQAEFTQIHVCPADHELQQFCTDMDGYTCSTCQSEFPEGTTLSSCRDCDFDACDDCLKTMKVKKIPVSPASKPAAKEKSKKRVRMGKTVPAEKFNPAPRPGSPKDTKFRERRQRRGSFKSALLLDRVLRFKDLEPWHCAILRLIAHNSHESDVATQRERYSKMDKNKSGAVSRDDLEAAMLEHGNIVNEEQLEGIFVNLDSQGTGEIEYNEWIAATLKPSIICQEEVMKMVFSFFDTKHRGCFGLEELKPVFGANMAQNMLKKAGVEEFTWDNFMDLMKEAATH